jgi:hypothetical protein
MLNLNFLVKLFERADFLPPRLSVSPRLETDETQTLLSATTTPQQQQTAAASFSHHTRPIPSFAFVVG